MRLAGCFSALAVVARRAGCDQVVPRMGTAQVPRIDMVNGQLGSLGPAVLASVVVPSEDFGFGEFYDRARPFDHMLETDNGGGGVIRGDCFDISPAIPYQPGLLREDQDQSAFGSANIERLKVRVQNQDRRRQARS